MNKEQRTKNKDSDDEYDGKEIVLQSDAALSGQSSSNNSGNQQAVVNNKKRKALAATDSDDDDGSSSSKSNKSIKKKKKKRKISNTEKKPKEGANAARVTEAQLKEWYGITITKLPQEEADDIWKAIQELESKHGFWHPQLTRNPALKLLRSKIIYFEYMDDKKNSMPFYGKILMRLYFRNDCACD